MGIFFWRGGGNLEGDSSFYYCATMHFELEDCIPRQDYWNVVLFFIQSISGSCLLWSDFDFIIWTDAHACSAIRPAGVYCVSGIMRLWWTGRLFAVNWDAQLWSQLSPDRCVKFCCLFLFVCLFSFMLLKEAIVLVSIFRYLDV